MKGKYLNEGNVYRPYHKTSLHFDYYLRRNFQFIIKGRKMMGIISDISYMNRYQCVQVCCPGVI